MKSKLLLFWLAVLFLFGGIVTILSSTGRLGRRPAADVETTVAAKSGSIAHPQPEETARPAGPVDRFVLVDQMGREFDSDTLKGKVWVASIFFALCPGTCRSQNAQVARLQHEFGDRGVELVSITCDPEHDTTIRLNEYSKLFNADPERWHFLTGDFEKIKRIGNELLQLVVAPETHSDRLVLIDRAGEIRGSYRANDIAQFGQLCQAIEAVLSEDAPSTAGDATIGES